MRTPRTFVCYAPRAGLRCALAYLPGEHDAYGWFTGANATGRASAYFVLEDFYTPRETRYVEVREADLHSRWTRDEARCHELAALQEAFTREWLFYPDDPDAALQLARYAAAELAVGPVGLRFEQLNRLSKGQACWTHYARDFEHKVLEQLSRHWPLDHRVEPE